MKNFFRIFVVLLILLVIDAKSQNFTDSWGISFGATSPRLMGDIPAEKMDFGGHLSLVRELNEVDFFRLSFYYLNFTASPSKFENKVITAGFDYGRKVVYCGLFDLYLGVGGGIISQDRKKGTNIKAEKHIGEVYARIFAGGYYKISDNFTFKAEMGQNTVSSDKFDGTRANGGGGLFGGSLDTYIHMDFGFTYWFSRGEKSDICDDCGGGVRTAKAEVDYDKIEAIVKKYTQQPVNVDYNKIEDIVKKYADKKVSVEHTGNWVLVGVNFETNKSSLTAESYPILANAVSILLSNPEMQVEIQGHTDNVGSDDYNKKLSLQRAETVKRYLVSKGVSASRLTTVGMGKSQPVADNKTAEGRSLNRRIEFKVIKK